MLALPERGFQPSKKKHNVDLEIATDWVEASVGFIDDLVSQGDVVDMLQENEVYDDQDFAAELVGNIWVELRRREDSMGTGSPFETQRRVVRRVGDWRSVPEYSFCLLLSLQAWYRKWASGFEKEYTVQGDLFEQLTADCLTWMGWDVHVTGWSPGNASKIRAVVSALAGHLQEDEIPGAVEKWFSSQANEEGLDLVCSNPFPDGRGGRPLFFFQCASGANWTDKLNTPNLDVWTRVISYTTKPQCGFSLPFGLLDKEFERSAGAVNGFLLDRYRLLAPAFEGCTDWTSRRFQRDLRKWSRPRIQSLPCAND